MKFYKPQKMALTKAHELIIRYYSVARAPHFQEAMHSHSRDFSTHSIKRGKITKSTALKHPSRIETESAKNVQQQTNVGGSSTEGRHAQKELRKC